MIDIQTLVIWSWLFRRHFLETEQSKPVISKKKKLVIFVATDKI
jgi:hypothetical protein